MILEINVAEMRCPVRLVGGGAPHGGHVKDADVALQQSLRAFAIDSIPGPGMICTKNGLMWWWTRWCDCKRR